MTEDGKPYGPTRYKELVQERYLLTKHTNTSYDDLAKITPLERGYLLEFLIQDLEKQKAAYEKAQAESEARRNRRSSSR